jgi:hypothetical protein
VLSAFVANAAMPALHDHSIRLRVKAHTALFLIQAYAEFGSALLSMTPRYPAATCLHLIMPPRRVFDGLLVELSVVNTLEASLMTSLLAFVLLMLLSLMCHLISP